MDEISFINFVRDEIEILLRNDEALQEVYSLWDSQPVREQNKLTKSLLQQMEKGDQDTTIVSQLNSQTGTTGNPRLVDLVTAIRYKRENLIREYPELTDVFNMQNRVMTAAADEAAEVFSLDMEEGFRGEIGKVIKKYAPQLESEVSFIENINLEFVSWRPYNEVTIDFENYDPSRVFNNDTAEAKKFVKELNKVAKENNLVISYKLESGMLFEDIFTDSDVLVPTSEASPTNSRNTFKDHSQAHVYYPEGLETAQNKYARGVQKYLFEDITFREFNDTGIQITTNKDNHKVLKQRLDNIFQSRFISTRGAFEGTITKSELVGGLTSSQGMDKMSPVFNGTNRYDKWFEKKSFEDIRKKPSYVIGMVSESPDGTKNFISFVTGDRFGNYGNTISSSGFNNMSEITADFVGMNPRAITGYVPNHITDEFSKVHSRAFGTAQNWWKSLMHKADVEGIVLTNRPASPQVFQLYDHFGFVSDVRLQANDTDISGGMTRIPNPNNPVDELGRGKRSSPEYRITLDVVEDKLWGGSIQEIVSVSRNKTIMTPENVHKHPVVKALRTLGEIDELYPDVEQFQNTELINKRILKLAIPYGNFDNFDSSSVLELWEKLGENDYLYTEEIIDKLKESIKPKDLSQFILRSSQFASEVTGVPPNEAGFGEIIETGLKNNQDAKFTDALVRHMAEVTNQPLESLGAKKVKDVYDESSPYTKDEVFAQYYHSVDPTDTPVIDRATSQRNLETIEEIENALNERRANVTPLADVVDTDSRISSQFNNAALSDVWMYQEVPEEIADYGRLTRVPDLSNMTMIEGGGRLVIDDDVRHKYIRNLQGLHDLDYPDTYKILTADIEFVGKTNIEAGVVILNTRENTISKYYHNYYLSHLGEDISMYPAMVSKDYSPMYEALFETIEEIENASENPRPINFVSSDDLVFSKYPSGRIAEAMRITNEGEVSNMAQGNVLDFTELEINPSRRAELRHLEVVKQQDIDITPQPFYTEINYDNPDIGVKSVHDTNNMIKELDDIVDNKTNGAYLLRLRHESADNTLTYITVKKRHNAPHTTSEGLEISLELQNGQLTGSQGQLLKVDRLTIMAPQQDFYNNVIFNSIEISEELSAEGFNRSVDQFARRVRTGSRQGGYDVTINPVVEIVTPELTEAIAADYSLGRQLDYLESQSYYAPAFRPEREPVPSNPSPRQLRKIASAFAKTPVGRTLGYAWKTIDIGETLIGKAFQQAQKAALAAGAVSLGGAAATAASMWALYEISNLVVAAGQQTDDLYNVFKRRNEILSNGEDWEKEIAEQTFWQDYGPELWEILEIASDRSPSEILGEKIWGFALDNLMRQSEGEVFEEGLIDDSEELDTRDDIWNSSMPPNRKLEQMQNYYDYDKVFTGYLNDRPDANVIANRTLQLANSVYNGNR